MTTFVLLHGSYQGGWIWQPVAERLRAQGHLVYAPSLDGCADRAGSLRAGITVETQAAEVVQLLFYENLNDVVLVATSSGGMVMAKVAESARERISRLVFADALALQNGEKVSDIVTRPSSIITDLALGPSREDAEGRLFASLGPEMRAWAVERCSLHPIAVHKSPVALDSFWSQDWKATVIYCRQAPNPGEAHQRRCAETLGASWHEIDTGHYPMLSAPDELVKIIVSGD
ncbi:MAG: alpha/beta hydrolase [Rhodospirillaceae bacterium]|jgi:pimeloyl-ACP methyl ester carboxylesterase|nr:alpha/beta hydrolase [Rhodospirillaceae bacterium]MBT5079157.1 alpha/beta hydrolase [Rhodospirillaceae bacterium]MBT5527477.1 alpha/beta hydrolase [Rhodospirillaceae bacterium]MBT6588777.1 alpha/beta hydrolase [Rhodospirillaceae bacterium]MBT6912613.1 alpha/beta hydrolase [Rhodospirillaceae bacterium]